MIRFVHTHTASFTVYYSESYLCRWDNVNFPGVHNITLPTPWTTSIFSRILMRLVGPSLSRGRGDKHTLATKIVDVSFFLLDLLHHRNKQSVRASFTCERIENRVFGNFVTVYHAIAVGIVITVGGVRFANHRSPVQTSCCVLGSCFWWRILRRRRPVACKLAPRSVSRCIQDGCTSHDWRSSSAQGACSDRVEGLAEVLVSRVVNEEVPQAVADEKERTDELDGVVSSESSKVESLGIVGTDTWHKYE